MCYRVPACGNDGLGNARIVHLATAKIQNALLSSLKSIKNADAPRRITGENSTRSCAENDSAWIQPIERNGVTGIPALEGEGRTPSAAGAVADEQAKEDAVFGSGVHVNQRLHQSPVGDRGKINRRECILFLLSLSRVLGRDLDLFRPLGLSQPPTTVPPSRRGGG